MKKKITKLLLFCSFFMGICLCSIPNVFAQTSTLTRTKVDNYYYERTRPNYYFSYQHSFYTFNGKIAYCIEPGIDITESNYTMHEDISASNISESQMNQALLYAYYGYGYNGGNMSTRFRVATQKLVWETVSDFHFEYYTERYGYGDYINLSNEINIIKNLANNHFKRPSFNGQTITAQVGETITLTDTNGVLSNFEVYGNNIGNIVIDGNNLSFKTTSVGNIELKLVKKQYLDIKPIVYTAGNSQKMLSAGMLDPVYTIFNVNSLGGKASIEKLDADTKLSIPRGDSELKGALYGIYTENDVRVGQITTNELAKGISDYLPSLGKFYLKEEQNSLGYTLDSTKYYFEITLDDLYPTIKVYEKVIERDIEIFKVYANANTTILKSESNITFDFYLKSNMELYESATTNNDGKLKVSLPYGTYVVKQKNTTPNHEKVEDFEIVIDSNNKEPIYKVISNAEITAKLKVIKVDKDTGNIIKRTGIKFKIKNVDTNEYVCQKITYPIASTICEYDTNDGILMTPYPLNSGNYRLEEVDQKIDGYLWNSESEVFKIGVESEFISDKEYGILFEVKFSNKAVYGEIDITKNGEKLIIEDGSYKYEKIKLNKATFNLYANEDIYSADGILKYKKDSLIQTLITNENGYAKIEKLYLGKYYLIEQSNEDNNIVDTTKYFIELSYIDQYTEIISISMNLENYLAKGIMEFTKTDFSDNKPLPNTLIEIYNEEDILMFSGRTDENGEIIISDLPLGKYYILEKEAPVGYVLNTEKMYFEIKTNGEIVKSNMVNELVKVPNTNSNDGYYLYIAMGTLIIIGVGLIIYDKKKK